MKMNLKSAATYRQILRVASRDLILRPKGLRLGEIYNNPTIWGIRVIMMCTDEGGQFVQ